MSETAEKARDYQLLASERQEQTALFDWAEWQGNIIPELKLLAAIPNGQVRTGQTLEPGLRKGFPDTFLPVARKGYHGLLIELKVGRNQPSPEQVEWLEKLSEQGYLAVAAWGAEEAIEILSEYLGLPPSEV
jgi:hypothetical protein